jgi:hypothetical protein
MVHADGAAHNAAGQRLDTGGPDHTLVLVPGTIAGSDPRTIGTLVTDILAVQAAVMSATRMMTSLARDRRGPARVIGLRRLAVPHCSFARADSKSPGVACAGSVFAAQTRNSVRCREWSAHLRDRENEPPFDAPFWRSGRSAEGRRRRLLAGVAGRKPGCG